MDAASDGDSVCAVRRDLASPRRVQEDEAMSAKVPETKWRYCTVHDAPLEPAFRIRGENVCGHLDRDMNRRCNDAALISRTETVAWLRAEAAQHDALSNEAETGGGHDTVAIYLSVLADALEKGR
jgi:hypothetical protein